MRWYLTRWTGILLGLLVVFGLLEMRPPPLPSSANGLLPSAQSTLTPYAYLPVLKKPYRVHGLNFGPYVDGQDPVRGDPVTEQQLRERMRIIAAHTRWVRTFGCGNGLEIAPRIAREMRLKVAVTAWLGPETDVDGAGQAANHQQVACLIRVAQMGEADIAIVGSEVLRRGDLSAATLEAYIRQVREAIPAAIPVTSADTFDKLLDNPTVVEAVDVVFANYYPFWQGLPVERAVAALHQWHQRMMASSGEKSVVVSETGWPSCGGANGGAFPSSDNAVQYFLNFVSWARSNGVPYFYFEALDESWKAAYEGPAGACWGVWDKMGRLKPGMELVFDGVTMPNNWTGRAKSGAADARPEWGTSTSSVAPTEPPGDPTR